MVSSPARSIPVVLQQHLDDTLAQRNTRSVLLRAPHVRLRHLSRLDERLSASLDGLGIGDEAARDLCLSALASPSRGAIFAAALIAIGHQNRALLDKLLAVVETVPELESALTSAFGWTAARSLRGISKPLLESDVALHRRIGIASCRLHQVNPGNLLSEAVSKPSPWRVEALTTAGRLGRIDLLSNCKSALEGADTQVSVAAARAALLLGDRDRAIVVLNGHAAAAGPRQVCDFMLVLKAMEPTAALAFLKSLAHDPAQLRLLIRGAGVSGNPHYIPWLIKQMADLKLTRLAGEAFSMITGLDLAYIDFDTRPPEDAVFGPNDDPADADVAIDEDDSLPWPDVEKISAWWQAHGARFKPGTRYFVGEPPTIAHCLSVLKTGFQRQRIAAAEYLCLLQPGTPLFNVAAPAWRQERLLAQMGA